MADSAIAFSQMHSAFIFNNCTRTDKSSKFVVSQTMRLSTEGYSLAVPGHCNVEAEPAGSGGDSHCTAQTSGLPSAVILKSSPRGKLLVKQHYYFRYSFGEPTSRTVRFIKNGALLRISKKNPTLMTGMVGLVIFGLARCESSYLIPLMLRE